MCLDHFNNLIYYVYRISWYSINIKQLDFRLPFLISKLKTNIFNVDLVSLGFIKLNTNIITNYSKILTQ